MDANRMAGVLVSGRQPVSSPSGMLVFIYSRFTRMTYETWPWFSVLGGFILVVAIIGWWYRLPEGDASPGRTVVIAAISASLSIAGGLIGVYTCRTRNPPY